MSTTSKTKNMIVPNLSLTRRPIPNNIDILKEEIKIITKSILADKKLIHDFFLSFSEVSSTKYPKVYLPKKRYNLLQVLHYFILHFKLQEINDIRYEKLEKQVSLYLLRLFLVFHMGLSLCSEKINLYDKEIQIPLQNDLIKALACEDILLDSFLGESKYPLAEAIQYIINKINNTHKHYMEYVLYVFGTFAENCPLDNMKVCFTYLKDMKIKNEKSSGDLDIFNYLLGEFIDYKLTSIEDKFTPVQFKQLITYMKEIFVYLSLIVMGTMSTRQEIRGSVRHLEFLHDHVKIRVSLKTFKETSKYSNNLFSDILKVLNVYTVQILGFYYNQILPSSQEVMESFLKPLCEADVTPVKQVIIDYSTPTPNPVSSSLPVPTSSVNDSPEDTNKIR